MAQLVFNQFHAALVHLLAQEGRGAQTRLANQQKIDRGYLNAIVKSRKSGSENIRSKIADHFDMAYEDMLILGRHLLEGTKDTTSETYNREKHSFRESPPRTGSKNQTIDFKIPPRNGKASSIIPDKIVKAIELLESGTDYGDLLAGLIDTFHDTISTKKENLALRKKMGNLESRIADLEKRLASKKECVRKSG